MMNDLTNLDKFISTCPTFWVHNCTCASDRARERREKSARPIENQLETVISATYYLNWTCNFHFLMYFILNIFISSNI